MLDEKQIPYTYRDYKKDPLSETELRDVLRMLGLPAKDVLRTKDAAFETLGLTGEETDEVLIPHMAQHPTLLQRPIGIRNGRAVVGRPPENLLDLVE